ncbi:MAG: hypothetical protein ACFE0K_07285 [Alcanivorax sp.]|uniref:hypothetical protein n=1 Tax=Alcanivorax sp. TaxID=1872427 RepID=UPI003DA725AC
MEEILWFLAFGVYLVLLNDRREIEYDESGNLIGFFRGFRWFSPLGIAFFLFSLFSVLVTYSHIDLLSKFVTLAIGVFMGLLPAIYFWFRRVSLKGYTIEGVGPFNGKKRICLDEVVIIKMHGDKRLGRWSSNGATIHGNGTKIQVEGFLSGYEALIEAVNQEVERLNSNKITQPTADAPAE